MFIALGIAAALLVLWVVFRPQIETAVKALSPKVANGYQKASEVRDVSVEKTVEFVHEIPTHAANAKKVAETKVESGKRKLATRILAWAMKTVQNNPNAS